MTITRYPLADPADLPDLDRHTPAGLCWRAPLDSRPILLGVTAPTLLPALATDFGPFHRGSEYGLSSGRSSNRVWEAAERLAFQPAPTTGSLSIDEVVQAVVDHLAVEAEYAEVAR